jgi:hypothetical protein
MLRSKRPSSEGYYQHIWKLILPAHRYKIPNTLVIFRTTIKINYSNQFMYITSMFYYYFRIDFIRERLRHFKLRNLLGPRNHLIFKQKLMWLSHRTFLITVYCEAVGSQTVELILHDFSTSRCWRRSRPLPLIIHLLIMRIASSHSGQWPINNFLCWWRWWSFVPLE